MSTPAKSTPASVGDIEAQIQALQKQRAEAMAPLLEEGRALLASAEFDTAVTGLQALAERLPADSGERTALRSLVTTVGHCRNVFRSGR